MDNIDKILIQIGIDTKPLDRNKQEALQKLRELATGAEKIGKDSGKGFERGFKRSARDIQQAGMLVFSFLGSYLGNVFADKFSGTMKEGIAGAIAGAGIGSMFSPVLGTIIGAGVGGILGVVTKGLLEYREQLKNISTLSEKFNVPKDKVKELFDVAAGADKKETVTKVLERWSRLMDEIIKKNPQVIQALKNAGVISNENMGDLIKMTPEDIERQAVLNPLYEFQKTYRTGTPPQLDDNLMLIFLNKYLTRMQVEKLNRSPYQQRSSFTIDDKWFNKKLPSTDLTQSEVESWIRTLLGENPVLGKQVVETITKLFGGSNKAYTEALSKYLKQDFDIMAMPGDFQSGPDFLNRMIKRRQGVDEIEYEKRKQAQKAKDAEELQRLQEKLNEYETESLSLEGQKEKLLKEVRQLMWDIQDTEEGSIENMRMKIDIAEKEKKISEVTTQTLKARSEVEKERASISNKRLKLDELRADRNAFTVDSLASIDPRKLPGRKTAFELNVIRTARQIKWLEEWAQRSKMNRQFGLESWYQSRADLLRKTGDGILSVTEANPLQQMSKEMAELNQSEKVLLAREAGRGLNIIPHMATRR